jgi:hypothetical protein
MFLHNMFSLVFSLHYLLEYLFALHVSPDIVPHCYVMRSKFLHLGASA